MVKKETLLYIELQGLPDGSVVKKKYLPANAGDRDLIPSQGRSPGEGNDNPLQYSCLEIPMDREIVREIVFIIFCV